MAGPRPQDDYNPNPTVQPETSSPANYNTTLSTPDAFGAQTGRAVQGFGQQINQTAEGELKVAIQRQGLINETVAAKADLDLDKANNDTTLEFKDFQGPAAEAHRLAYTQKLQDNYDKIRAGLPSDAVRKMFDIQSIRRMGYSFHEITDWAHTQVRQGLIDTKKSALEQELNNITGVGLDDEKFGTAMGNMKFDLATIMETQGYTQVDPKTGAVTFNKSADGTDGQVVYNAELDKLKGQAWENRIDGMALDPVHHDIKAATELFEAHSAEIPAAARARIQAKLYPLYRNYQMGAGVSDVLKDIDNRYNNQISGSTTYDNNSLHRAFLGQESSGNPNVPDSDKGALGIGQIEQNTWDTAVKAGIIPKIFNIHNAQDNAEASGLLVDHYMHEFGNDPRRAAVAYFSGEGNVAPPDSPTPWITDKSDGKVLTSEYVAGIMHRLGGGTPQTGSYVSPSAWNMDHYGESIQAIRDRAHADFPRDPEMEEREVSMGTTQLNAKISALHKPIAEAKNNIIAKIQELYNQGKPITDASELLAIPGIGEQWANLLQNDSAAAVRIQTNIIPSFTRGRAPTFGTNFWGAFSDTMSGKVDDATQLAGPGYMDGSVDPKHQPLTNAGFGTLQGIMTDIHNDPTKRDAYQQFFRWAGSKEVRGSITGTGFVPGWHNVKTDKNFEDFIMSALPQFQAGLAKGLKPSDMMDPTSKDYVGGAMKQYNMKMMKNDMLENMPVSPTSTAFAPPRPFDPNSIKTDADILKARDSKQITREQGRAIYDRIHANDHKLEPIPTPH